MLAFRQRAPSPLKGSEASASLYSANARAAPRRPPRAIPQQPERILDAPELMDDYYLNLLDWGSSNVLGVALGPAVYLWHADTGSCDELLRLESESDYVSSVSWAKDGRHLAVGLSDSRTQIWDAEKGRPVRSLSGHSARVGSLSWNGTTLATGSRDGSVLTHDVRVRDHVVGRLQGHGGEVCGLAWNASGSQLASGGNDNAVLLWDAARASGVAAPQLRLTAHSAAVKALAWCPFQSNLLATGGGSADRHIRFWNTATGAQLNAVDTGSQVCALAWSAAERELLSSHGYAQNQLCLWKYPTMAKVAELRGHSARVLHLAPSPDGARVASAAADETIRLWKVFGGAEEREAAQPKAGHSLLRSIR